MNSSEQCGHNELTLIDWSSLAELHNAHPTAVAVASAELRMNDVAKVATKPRTRLPELTDKVPTDKNAFRCETTSSPTIRITETNELIHSTITVVLQTLGYKINACRESHHPHLWRRWLEIKKKK